MVGGCSRQPKEAAALTRQGGKTGANTKHPSGGRGWKDFGGEQNSKVKSMGEPTAGEETTPGKKYGGSDAHMGACQSKKTCKIRGKRWESPSPYNKRRQVDKKRGKRKSEQRLLGLLKTVETTGEMWEKIGGVG